MFKNCKSLKWFPDISEWNFNKDCNRDYIFEGVDKKIVPKFKGCLIY